MSFLVILSPRKILSHTRRGLSKVNWEFWIGNFFVVFSTVLGVYLASHAALETAIKYDSLRTDRDNYYVRTSLYNELNHNISVFEEVIPNLRKGRRYYKNDQYITHPQYFVWESLKKSPAALTTPPKILAGVSHFYENTGIILNKLDQRKNFKDSFSANELEELVNDFKKETMPLIQQNLAELKNDLKQSEIQFE